MARGVSLRIVALLGFAFAVQISPPHLRAATSDTGVSAGFCGVPNAAAASGLADLQQLLAREGVPAAPQVAEGHCPLCVPANCKLALPPSSLTAPLAIRIPAAERQLFAWDERGLPAAHDRSTLPPPALAPPLA
jgi:hypothetical protein